MVSRKLIRISWSLGPKNQFPRSVLTLLADLGHKSQYIFARVLTSLSTKVKELFLRFLVACVMGQFSQRAANICQGAIFFALLHALWTISLANFGSSFGNTI